MLEIAIDELGIDNDKVAYITLPANRNDVIDAMDKEKIFGETFLRITECEEVPELGTDENGTPKQASVRSTLSFGKTFRITVANSDTKYSFSHFGNDEKLFVFEAPIDMLSFITLYQKDWQQHS